MVNKDDGIIDVNLRLVAANGGSVARVKIDVSQTAFDCGIDEVDTRPERTAWLASEANMRRIIALGQQAPCSTHCNPRTGQKIDGRPGLDPQSGAGGNTQNAGDNVGTTGRCPEIASRERAARADGRGIVKPNINVRAGNLDGITVEGLNENSVDTWM